MIRNKGKEFMDAGLIAHFQIKKHCYGWSGMEPSSIFWKLDRNFTEGEGRKVVCAPDDGLLLPPLAPPDIGQVLGLSLIHI